MVGHWDLREGSGFVANDRSSASNSGSIIGAEYIEDSAGGTKEFRITIFDAGSDDNTSSSGERLTSSTAVADVNLTTSNDKPYVANANLSIEDTTGDDTFNDLTGTLTASDVETNRVDLRFSLENGTDLSSNPYQSGGKEYQQSVEKIFTRDNITYSYGILYLNTTTGDYLFQANDAGIERLHSNQSIPFNVEATDNGPGTSETSPQASITLNVTAVDDSNSISLGTIGNFTEQTNVVIAPNATVTAARDGITQLNVQVTGEASTISSTDLEDTFESGVEGWVNGSVIAIPHGDHF